MHTRKVLVCNIPFDMSIVEGGVLFCNRGSTARYMWEYRARLWCLMEVKAAAPIPGTHLKKMHNLLNDLIGRDYTEFPLKFLNSRVDWPAGE